MRNTERKNGIIPKDKETEQIFRTTSKTLDIEPENLNFLYEKRVKFPLTKIEINLFKVFNTKTKESTKIAFDLNNAVVDHNKLLEKEVSQRYDKYGNLQSELYRIANLEEERLIPVLIKLSVTEEYIDKTKLESVKDLENVSKKAQSIEKDVEQKAIELFEKIVSEFKIEYRETEIQSGPFIGALLPSKVILKLSKDKRISFIGFDKEKEIRDSSIPDSLPTTNTEWVHGDWIKGKDVRIAVLEDGALSQNSSLFNIAKIQITGFSRALQTANQHMTNSVGIIGNNFSGSWEGYAPEAEVLVANANNYRKRYRWAKNNGLNVGTMSWHYDSEETDGDLHSRDIYFDYMVNHCPWPTIFTSAGNEAALNAFSSGKGYNFLGVADVLNDADGNRCNDAIANTSSSRNPTSHHGDREIPEIAAPGSAHTLLGTIFPGTSCATAVTASIAALLMDCNSDLKIWPEAIRAILLATATFQGSDGTEWSTRADGRDGTGLINSFFAYLIALERVSNDDPNWRGHDYGHMNKGDFNGFFRKSWKIRTNTTNCRVRVAITWNSKTYSVFGHPTSSELDADLDLYIYDPNGNLIDFSVTWDNNYEFVDFIPIRTGSYSIRIYGFDVPEDFSSYYGVAWTVHYEDCP